MSALPAKLHPARSLRARLAFTVGVAALLFAVLLSWVVGRKASVDVEADKGVLASQLARQIANELDEGLHERWREIQMFAVLETIRDPWAPLDKKRALLEALQHNSDDYAWIGLTDSQGKIIAGSDKLLEGVNVAQREWFTGARNSPYLGDVHDAFMLTKLIPQPKGDPLPLRLVDISAPVLDANGRFLGVLCGHLSWSWASRVRDQVLTPLKTPGQLEAMVLNRNGKILLGTTLTTGMQQLSLDSIRQAATGRNHYTLEDWPDGRYLTGYAQARNRDPRQFGGLGWVVLVRQPAGRAFATATTLQRGTLITGAAFALLFMALIWVIVGRLVRPMVSIAEAADRISKGDASVRIPLLKGHDEASALSTSLSNLVEAMGMQKQELQTLNDRLELDISRREKAEEGLRLAAQVFAHSAEGIIITDADAHVLTVNQAFTEITGYSYHDVIGQNPRIWKSDKHDAEFYREMWQEIIKEGKWQGEVWNRRKNGNIFPVWLTISAVCNESGHVTHYVAIYIDMTERKATEERILHLAQHDVLTDLPNRMLLLDRLGQAIAQAHRNNTRVALLFMDLDRFKTINDSLGHHVGDSLLKKVAQQLSGCLREGDTVARLGGDEFVIVLPQIVDAQDAAHVAQKITETLAQRFDIEGHQLHASVSIGISIYPEDGQDVVTLMRNADTAMYYAKEMGRNHYQFFTGELNVRIHEKLLLENALRLAVERNEFCLHYQPQIDIGSGKQVGVEALLRWKHPELGLIFPDRFIGIAEETGLIIQIGEWVLREACLQRQRWAKHHPALRMAVNLSAVQFRNTNLCDIVARALQNAAMEPQFLELEITETVIMGSAEHTITTLEKLSIMGVQIAIDDFGTGYSSLSYLKRFPIDKIKIDRSFVRDISTDPDDAAIVAAIIAMARNLKLKVLAEGTETSAQFSFLETLRCDETQGYYFSRPLPGEEIEQLLAQQQPLPLEQ
ncbi:MAG: EAL domain-containing protein [Pseudomonadota bacterium]